MARAHPGLDYAFVANEQMAFAARKAFDAADADQVRMVTVNGTDEALAALKDGRFSATVSNSAGNTGELAVRNTIVLLRDRTAKKIDHTPIRLVTKGNARHGPFVLPRRLLIRCGHRPNCQPPGRGIYDGRCRPWDLHRPPLCCVSGALCRLASCIIRNEPRLT
ncbi:sugar ABC transporter substrate-binding protein [Streptomyces tendae]|uniref:sugar ABC transporter substrate-binding protein n=1 Tax=Streptomyces tendae TaxID=1932 RepID=UPI0036614005